MPVRRLERAHALAAWEATPVERGAAKEDAEDEAVLGAADEQTVAKTDPEMGLIRMQLLARIGYLLGSAVESGGAGPLLCILIRYPWTSFTCVGV